MFTVGEIFVLEFDTRGAANSRRVHDLKNQMLLCM